MKFFTNLVNFVKKIISSIANMIKDKNPVEVVNDIAKTATAVATAGLAIYAGINAVKVYMIPATKKNYVSNGKSGMDYMLESREAGSIDSKILSTRKNASRIGKKNTNRINREDSIALAEIAKTRNSFFQSLSPEEQLSVLEMEEFDFAEYKLNMKRKSKKRLFKLGERLKRLGVSPEDKPFRETVNYGFFNFILQPLDNFIHWFKNDPVPKKIPQIQVVDHPEIPNIGCETALDLVETARNLDSYLSHNKLILGEFNATSPASLEEQQILADEIFRHNSLKKFKKAVNLRMAHSEFNTPNILDLISDDTVSSKKDKKKKNKKKKKNSYECSDTFSFDDGSKKKNKKGMSKEEAKAESAADKRAKELYQYHLEKAMNGEFDRKGFKFEF